MKKFNDKNLRREVRRQLKELHGRVGMNAVGHGLTINGERLAVSGERLEGSDEGQSLNSHLSPFNSTEGSDEWQSLNSHLSTFKVCANERESSSLEFSQQVQPKLNDLVINSHKPTLPELEQFIRRDYDLRYNVLTEQTEYRRKDDAQAEFRPATQRVYRPSFSLLPRYTKSCASATLASCVA